MNFYLFIEVKKGGGGCALVHVYVLEHIVSLNYKIAWLIFTKLGRDKVLMTRHICIDSWAKSAQGWIQGRAKIGHGGVPFSKELLLQTERLQQHTECIEVIYKHLGRSIVIFGFIGKSNFLRVLDVFLDLDILVYFNAISMDFCAIKSWSALNLWENA